MVFQGLDKLMKLTPLSALPKWMSTDDDEDEEEEQETSQVQQDMKKAMVRMRNIFATPFDFAKEGFDDLKDLIGLDVKNAAQTEFLQHAFQQHFVLQHLSSKESKILLGAMILKSISKNETIIEQGQKGDYLYVIQEGTVRFIVDGTEQTTRGEAGQVFGELSLLYDCPTAASVIAETDVKVWRVSQYNFRRIKAAHAIQGDKDKRDTITSISFFRGLPNEYIYKLADSLLEKRFKKGETLSQKGTQATTMFILKEGYVMATDISVGKQKLADIRLGPGDHFGERAIVTGEPVAGNGVALSDGVAWIITKERFLKTVGHLNLEDLILKSQDKKLLSAIPLFAYSDIDYIETELLADQIKDFEYKKGYVFGQVGEPVVPALYIIRMGSVTLSNDKGTKTLTVSEVFGFGGDTLILTNQLKEKNLTISNENEIQQLLRESQVYANEAAFKNNSVPAIHTVMATEDCKIGMLTLRSISKVLHDPFRLGRRASVSNNQTLNTSTLERKKVLGAGTFGTVYLTRHAATETPYALKVQYKRQLIEFHQATGVIREKNVMARMHHPFVMNLVNSQQDEKCLYMVMDFMQGGELGSIMHTRKRKHLAEGSCRFYAAGVLEGLSYMHRRHYVYRDLKGENVLLDNDGYAVIVDLGFAKFVPDKTFTFCGTPLFIAPEVIQNTGHDKSADIWSYGILLYEMLTGESPFYKEDMDQLALFKAICKGKFKYPHNSHASANARDLVDKILVLDPKDRLGCMSRADLDIRNHPWFDGFDFGALYRKELTPPWQPKISNPFDGSNFGNWKDPDKKKQNLKPLTKEEQQKFVEFGR